MNSLVLIAFSLYYEMSLRTMPVQRHWLSQGGEGCMVLWQPCPQSSWLLPPFIAWLLRGCAVPRCARCWGKWKSGGSSEPMELLLYHGVPSRTLRAMRGWIVCRESENNKTDWMSVCILLLPCAHNSKPCHWLRHSSLKIKLLFWVLLIYL